MIRFVFRPSRVVDGRRVRSDVYSGRYALEKGQRPVTVPLNTPDREIAEKRLRDIVIERQRELEGLIPANAMRKAAALPLVALIDEYETDLKARDLAAKHVKATTRRLRRMVKETGWRVLADVTPDGFVKWRGSLTSSAKTKKEHQTSACAFLNWLVRNGRLAANPLAKVDVIDIRGKQVQTARAYTEAELQRLFAVAGRRRLVYQVLTYTGQRKEEVRALVWGDLHLDEERPFVHLREGTTKDKDKRAVPLHPELARELRQLRPVDAAPSARVFFGWFPTYESLRADLERAGIPHKDALGRVVHFHSFRKTWRTLGVRYGVNQRAAQEVLGHSDANLTARVYTDVPALGLHTEIAKLPWISATETNAQRNAQKPGNPGQLVSFADTLRQLLLIAKDAPEEELSHFLSACGTPCPDAKMVVGGGFEPP